MSEVQRLIEKLGLAIHGEQPSTVVKVLASFTTICLERWGVSLEEYVSELNRCRFFGVAEKPEPD